MKKMILTAFAMLALAACTQKAPESAVELFDAAAFATEIDGKPVSLYTLANENGMTVQVTNYGARVVDMWVPNAQGGFTDVVWGYENIEGYLGSNDLFCGPVVGRYGNRIGKGQFTLGDTLYQLDVNEGENTLHGGSKGFYNCVWDVKEADGERITLSYLSPDGEQGFPGNLSIEVTYAVTPDNSFTVTYRATTDAPTVLNPTSHCYFNLHGTNAKSTDSHILMIDADSFTPTDAALIPTGEIAGVEGTPLDFRTPTAIGERIDADFEALKFGKGYDHNWVLNKRSRERTPVAAEVYEPSTGIVMTVRTDQPALQFYSGNAFAGKDTGKRGEKNTFRTGIALETQNFPDAPNHENFPSSVLEPGQTYTQIASYTFGVR